MTSKSFLSALKAELPILFVNIGWTIFYDGTEAVVGNHKHLKDNPGQHVGESRAFKKFRGYFECGIGFGSMPERFHVVFASRDPATSQIKVVGLYANAEASLADNNWAFASTDFAERIAADRRPIVKKWPGGQGMRRWAVRSSGTGREHKALRDLFAYVAGRLKTMSGLPLVPTPAVDNDGAVEGALKKYWARHRGREGKLRKRKIEDALSKGGGRLRCEVPQCKFDFVKTYGELGYGFAEVHHRKPLKDAPKRGQKTLLTDLAIVCANCHRMIHRNGDCRPLMALTVHR